MFVLYVNVSVCLGDANMGSVFLVGDSIFENEEQFCMLSFCWPLSEVRSHVLGRDL